MKSFIEEFYYGNIEPQELSSELGSSLKKKLNSLVKTKMSSEKNYPKKKRNCFSNTQIYTTNF